MVLDVKLVIAAIITIGLAWTFLFSNPTVDSITGKISGKIPFLQSGGAPTQELNDVSFVLNADSYGNMVFEGQKQLRAEIKGATNGNIGGGPFDSDEGISLSGFSGRVSVGGDLAMNGTVEKVMLSGASITFGGKAYGSVSSFSLASIENLTLHQLTLENVTGSLRQNGTEISFSKTNVLIEGVSGRFTFGGGIGIDGYASRISIPKAGIIIG